MCKIVFYYLVISIVINNVLSIFLSKHVFQFKLPQKDKPIYNWKEPNMPLIQKYDFIIVGAGPAGCVLANRLSENPRWNILLLEAGKPESFLTDTPLAAPYLQSTSYNWDYTSEPQEGVCLGMKNQRCGLPRGKAIGGSSVINYMIYNRGNPYDFDCWSANGNKGWSYNEVLPYFLRSEGARLNGLENSPYHNKSGPWSIEYVSYRSKMAGAFLAGTKEAGYPEIDYNGESQLGTSYVQASTKKGRRHSASHAYLDPIHNVRKNLHIISSARVTRILMNEGKKKAIGVEFVKNKKNYWIRSGKEVILSAGTFNSPQLLMLSGIGPKDHLKNINVKVLQDLPVGRSMWDHMSHFGPTITLNTTRWQHKFEDLASINAIKEYLRGDGPYTSIGGVESLTFMKTNGSLYPETVPDLELIFSAGTYATDHGTAVRKGMKIKKSLYNKVYKPLERIDIDAFTIIIMLFHPKSKGYLELKDNNPFHWPKIYPNYFQDPEDIETILQGIREVERIIQSPTLQKHGAKIHDIPLPNCEHLQFGSDDYWRCSIRTLSGTLHHQVGTCKMGPVTDPTAVVNEKLQVHGIKRLRVVDTSVIPQPPTAHTNAASFMIGEKASDIIKNKWS